MNEADKLIPFKPSAALYYEYAFKAFHSGDYKKAVKYFSRGVSLSESKDEQIYGKVQLALAYQHNNQIDESIELIDELFIKTLDLYPDLHYFQAINYTIIGDYDKGLESIRTFLDNARETSPYFEEAFSLLDFLEGN